MIEIIKSNWLNNFITELKINNIIYIISPFISDVLVEHLIDNSNENHQIKVITRFNLNDFKSKVSSLSALEKLVNRNIEVKGIKNLHSKVYIFENKSVIIGSANFTSGGFFNNYEYGIKSTENQIVSDSKLYFDELWSLEKKILSFQDISNWREIIKNSPTQNPKENLPDFGVKASLNGRKTKKVYIKFFGKSDHRENLSYHSMSEIERSHCHWALTFSGKRGIPRRYNDGDIVYMARMLEKNDYAIFGKAIAIKHINNRDIASKEDINEISWKRDWPIYIRVENPIFIDATMKFCPKLSELMKELKYDSFKNTQKRFLNGEINLNVKDSLRRQADIELSDISSEWLEDKFQKCLIKNGIISQNKLDKLYKGIPSLDDIKT